MSLCEGCIKAQRDDTVTGVLHSNYHSLIDCIKRCRFCAFVCDLIGQETLARVKEEASSSGSCHIHLYPEERVNLNQTITLVWYHDFLNSFSGQNHSFATREVTVCGETSTAFSRPFWSSAEPPAIGDRIPTVLEWIRDCKENHSACVAPESPASSRPARFVDISDLNRGKTVRLIPTQVISQNEKIVYVTLSHCWGGVVPLRTTRANLNAHMKAIPYQLIPRTFRNAIGIAQALEIQYVWIDSLCIVQDDSEDWQTEAAKMHTIYRGARLTVSATSAGHPDDGPDLSVPLPAAHQVFASEKGQLPRRTISARHPGLPNPLDSFQRLAIHTRGWVFQERMLSPRILHVMRDELLWQCHTLIDSESGRCRSEKPSIRNTDWLWEPISSVYHVPPARGDEEGFSAMDRLWWTWVQSYTDRHLTYPGDIFPAFAGMVSQFQELSGDDPILGLWRKQLPFHLSWSPLTSGGAPSSETIAKIPPELHALTQSLPSWTWMSLPIPHIKPWTQNVEWTRVNHRELFPEVEAQDVQIAWSGHPWSSLPSKGVLKLRGRLLRVAETYVKPNSMISEPTAYIVENQALRGLIQLDKRPFRFERQREHFVALSLWSNRNRYQNMWYFMVLEPTGGDHEYRRVGRAYFYKFRRGDGPTFNEIGSIETITVV